MMSHFFFLSDFVVGLWPPVGCCLTAQRVSFTNTGFVSKTFRQNEIFAH